jgi:hypothetical protein
VLAAPGLFFEIFMPQFFYGLTNGRQLREIVVAVCGVLGYGGLGGFAVDLLMETAAQETHCGQFRDPTPYGAGRGAFQCDLIAFSDVVERSRPQDVKAISDHFGIDIRKVSHNALDTSPLLAAIIARLHYKLVPEPIPDSIAGRADYWKRYYNTSAGKGSPAEYVKNAREFAGVC